MTLWPVVPYICSSTKVSPNETHKFVHALANVPQSDMHHLVCVRKRELYRARILSVQPTNGNHHVAKWESVCNSM